MHDDPLSTEQISVNLKQPNRPSAFSSCSSFTPKNVYNYNAAAYKAVGYLNTIIILPVLKYYYQNIIKFLINAT